MLMLSVPPSAAFATTVRTRCQRGIRPPACCCETRCDNGLRVSRAVGCIQVVKGIVENVQAEWALACTGQNLLTLYRNGRWAPVQTPNLLQVFASRRRASLDRHHWPSYGRHGGTDHQIE